MGKQNLRPLLMITALASLEGAATILFLLSPAARHITGQTIFVDGGESIV